MQAISSLDWTDSPLKNPLAIYNVDFSVDLTWQWNSLKGYKDQVELAAKFVRVDNLDSNQFINVYFDNVRYPVNAFQLLTIPIPLNAVKCTIEGDASAPLTCEVTFAIDDISQADTYNFKEIQSSGTEGVLWPVFYKAGPWNFVGADDHTIQSFTIAAPIAVTLPDPTTVSNGWTIQIWNSQASTSNITLSVAGGVATIDGAASLALAPNSKTWLVLDGANGFTVVKVAALNPVTRLYGGNDTWTPFLPSQTLDYIEVEVIGGGGSGASTPATTASNSSFASGGGGGGWAFETISAGALNLAGETVTIGAGGAAPAAGLNNGNAGGTSSFGAHCSATGGAGGLTMANGSSGIKVPGGDGGIGVGGHLNIAGSDGGSAARLTGLLGYAGYGGGTYHAGSRKSDIDGQADGQTGYNYGGGGSGANSNNANPARPGGGGRSGLIIVREFYK